MLATASTRILGWLLPAAGLDGRQELQLHGATARHGGEMLHMVNIDDRTVFALGSTGEGSGKVFSYSTGNELYRCSISGLSFNNIEQLVFWRPFAAM